MSEPEWLTRARAEGRILSETTVRAGAVTADVPVDRPRQRSKKPRRSGLYASELNPKCTEKQFTADVLHFAKMTGWRSAHFRPAWTESRGRRRMITPVAGDGKGFLDIELVRGPRLLKIELKSCIGVLRPEQKTWITAYKDVAAVEVYVWKPKDWPVIREVLSL